METGKLWFIAKFAAEGGLGSPFGGKRSAVGGSE